MPNRKSATLPLGLAVRVDNRGVRKSNAVPSVALRHVQRLVRRIDEHFRGNSPVARRIEFGDTRGNRHAHVHSVVAEIVFLDFLADSLGDIHRFFAARPVEHHGEFLAAVPRRHVRVADVRADDGRDRLQDVIAARMAVIVVEFLEEIDVEHKDADFRLAAANRKVHLVGKYIEEIELEFEVRHHVRGRALDEGGIVDCNCRQRRHDENLLLVVFAVIPRTFPAVRADVDFLAENEDALKMPALYERNDERRAERFEKADVVFRVGALAFGKECHEFSAQLRRRIDAAVLFEEFD